MTRAEFIERLKEIMQIEDNEIDETTNMRDLPEFDSLALMSIIVFIDEHFQKTIRASEFKNVTTIKSLIELIGPEKFE